MIRILIAEDQGLVRGAMASLLRMEEDFDVVAEVADGEAALIEAQRLQPDIALLDIEMPYVSGLDVAERLPTVAPGCKALIVTTFARSGFMSRAVKAGAWGYLLKDARIEEISEAIRHIHAGQRVMSPALLVEAIAKPNPLSERERDILRMAKSGLTTRELVRALYLTEGTVRNYLSEIMAKLGAQMRQEVIRYADEQGWL